MSGSKPSSRGLSAATPNPSFKGRSNGRLPGLVRGVVTLSSAQAWHPTVGLPLNSIVKRHKSPPQISSRFSEHGRFALNAMRGLVAHRETAFAPWPPRGQPDTEATSKPLRPGAFAVDQVSFGGYKHKNLSFQSLLGSVVASTAETSLRKFSVWSSSPGSACARCWVSVGLPPRCRLTFRSRGGPTAGHQGPVGGTLYIFANRALASHRRPPP
jgi:hypothetical protein